jgi:hypothetical protein
MQVRTSIEFTDQDQEIINLLDKIWEAKMLTNSCGVDEWHWLAIGYPVDGDMQDQGPYYILQELWKRIALRFFEDNEELANNLFDVCLDNGELPSYNLKHNSIYVLRGMGVSLYGVW